MIHKTTRSILSVLLAALLLVTSTPLTPAFAGVGEAVSLQSESGESEGLTGSGAKENPYQIGSAEQLAKFRDKVNSGETDASAVLTADINLNPDMEISEDGTVTNGNKLNPWAPIGNSSINSYSGTFDGDGHTISGLYIDSSSANNQGLFGFVGSEGKVQNLSVSGSVSGKISVGGVVGHNEGGRVENCYNIGEVSGNIGVGGVVGQNIGGIVENCYNTGEVSGNSSVGGVVGLNDGNVTGCYNTGKVSGNSYVGGVVGENSGSSTVENCYNTGTVTGTDDRVGGVVGENSGSSSVTNCYFLKDTAGSGIGSGNPSEENVKSLTADQFKNQSSFTDWDFGIADTWTIHSVLGRPVLNENREGGLGSPESPYEISTADELENFRDLVNKGIEKSAHAKLMNNIDLSSVCGESNSWIPIGTSEENAYTGTFNGNGNTIENLYIKNTTNDYYQGLFGCLDQGGTVQDLTVSGSVKGSGWYVGGIVGYNGTGATVSNCYNTGQVNGGGYVGGVVGENSGSVINCTNTNTGTVTGTDDHVGGVVGSNNNGSVENCYNTGNISGGNQVGGVVGQNSGGVVGQNSGSVTNCYNIGDVSGKISVGGVVGYNDGASVTNCYNTDSVTVTGSGGRVGGVVGDNRGTVENCYNTGTVSGSDHVGGVVGWNSSDANVTNCYNTGKVSGRYIGGVVGSNSGTVENCYNTDSVSDGTTSGGVVGQNSGSVTNCYFLQTTEVNDKLQGIGGGSGTSSNVEARTDDAFHSGEVAWRLQDGQTAGSGQVWGQTLGGEEDSLPTLVALDKDAKPVYKVAFISDNTEIEAQYANSGMTVDLPATEPTKEGYTFSYWQDKAGTQVTEPITVTADTEFTAQWTKNTVNYTVTVTTSPAEGGTVNGGGTFAEGTQVTVTATANDGYTFVAWQEGDTQASTSASYTFELTGNRNLTAIFEKEPDPTPTPTPDPTPSGPSTGDSTGWDDILDELENAEKGEQITIDMGDETKVPAEIFESVAGKDVDVTFDLGDDLSWTVNGKDIPDDAALADLDLGVALDTDGIPVNVINTITGEHGSVQMTLAHDGAFGFTMTLTAPLGKENAGYWANLYHYKVNGGEADREDPLGDDEDAEALNFEAAAKIDEDGSVTIPFSHASQYAIVIDTHSHATVDVSDLFSDIARDAWYKDAVQYAYDNGLMTGVSDTEFAPEATTTRAMIVSILARLEGVTTAEAAGFADVDDEWYATAVNWAANVGVVNGYEDNTFRPNTAITREQLAAILMNYASYKGEDVSARADLTSYTDQPSAWAEETMSWSVAEGLLTGVTADTLQPQGAATRAQVAAILQRFLSE